VRAAVGEAMIVQITTEAVGRYTPADQRALVRGLAPEAVSLAVRELFPDDPAERAESARFLAWLVHETAILPQFIVYDAADVARFNRLRAEGVVPAGPAFLLFVLGRYAAGQVSRPRDLLAFLAAADPSDLWAACAFGPLEGAVSLTAAALGGHSRIGFENNDKMADGTAAPDNAALIAQTAGALGLTGRRPATASEAREILQRYRLIG
ncbi:MAG: 3-keto-5-aminohexanoate cleavage protein, partial [Alphaproteobacteria bacterium]|nr:3-keto-5-aminohexanoate cleavage protein [Alphaproteobacteria bacterium]